MRDVTEKSNIMQTLQELQGTFAVTVNAGPLKAAQYFLKNVQPIGQPTQNISAAMFFGKSVDDHDVFSDESSTVSQSVSVSTKTSSQSET